MEKADALALLEGLRDEISRLQNAEAGDALVDWYARTLAAVREIFGDGSIQQDDFARIRFDLSPEARRTLSEGLRDFVRDRFGAEIHAPSLGMEQYRRRGLSEAYELLTAEISRLRHELNTKGV